jgi:hypothetical protein
MTNYILISEKVYNTFYQQIGLNFKEGTIEMLHLERSFV